MRHIVTITLILVGILHVLPLAGVLGPDRLTSLYGITADEPNIAILMRHRAVLFGILGVVLIIAGFVPRIQVGALIAGFVSLTSFLWLAWLTGGYNTQVSRVVTADTVGLVVLLLGVAAKVASRSPAAD